MPQISTNIWQMTAMKDGIAASLAEAKNKLSNMYADSTSTLEDRDAQQNIVKDLTERLNGISAQIEAATSKSIGTSTQEMTVSDAFGALVKATMQNKSVSTEVLAALKDNDATGGNKLLPKTVSENIVTEAKVKNPLRGLVDVTSIANLELPKLSFTISDDDFIEDGETAKEMSVNGDNIIFGRHKSKIFCDVSETILNGSNANISAYVNAALQSGLAKKEKKLAFSTSPKIGEEHMSFYSSENNIKVVQGATLYAAIKNAIADLEEDYLDNCSIMISRKDYLSIIEFLANSSTDLYGKKPEEILGYPVKFCDLATKPIVGDFSYAQYNYYPEMTYERDKNVKTGMHSFVLTCWLDFRIKLASAFRICEVAGV